MQWVPLHYRDMERMHGDEADLLFLANPFDTRDFPVLPQPLLQWNWLKKLRREQVEDRWNLAREKLIAGGAQSVLPHEGPPLKIRPGTPGQRIWRGAKDWHLKKLIPGLVKKYRMDTYDIVHYHGGRDYTWNADLAKHLHQKGARIGCVYHGTDLRVEGVIPELDKLSTLNLTSEHDLINSHPNIYWLPLPFDHQPFPRKSKWNHPIRIVHAPSDRYNKGTDYILPIMERLSRQYQFEFVLVEGKTQQETRNIKLDCELCIDQVGNRAGSGFGISSLECFAMGVACISDFTPEVEALMPDHPFYLASPQTLADCLENILQKPELLKERGEKSREWLIENNSFSAVYQRKKLLYQKAGWI